MTQRIEIRETDADAADALMLFGAGHAAMQSLFPEKRKVAFAADMLKDHRVKLLLAYQDNAPAGCCAVLKQDEFCELKRLYVVPDRRGRGIAERLVRAVERVAQSCDRQKVMLESGSGLHGAHRLYLRLGYTKRDAFGGHKDAPESLFFEKFLDR